MLQKTSGTEILAPLKVAFFYKNRCILLTNILILTLLVLFFRFNWSYKQQLLVENPMAWIIKKKSFYVKNYIEPKSYIAVQTRFRGKFNFNTYPGKSQMFLWYIITFKHIEL